MSTTPAAPVRHDALAPLRHPAFRFLFIGRFATFIGNAVAPIALAFAVLDLTDSGAVLGLVIACRMVPQILLTLFGGVIADRFSRTRVMVVSSGLGALSQGICAALVLSGHAQIWQLAVIQAFNGAVSAFAFPASAGLTPQTVPEPILQQANALLRLVINAATIGGAALGGLLVASVGSGWALAVDAVTFAVAALVFGRIHLTPPATTGTSAEAPARPNMLHELRVGWREFASRTWLWSVVIAFAFINAAQTGSMGVLGPLVADDTVGRAAWGFVLSAVAVGMVVGGLVALRVRPRRTLLVGMLGIALMIPFLLTLAIHPTTPALVTAAFVSGIGIETFGIYWDLSMQQHVPQDVLSRVYSYDALGSWIFMPVGLIVAGPLAQAIGTEETLVWAAALTGVATIATIAVPSVRQLERTDVSAAT